MSDQTCPKCGQPLKDGELCPNCLLALAVSPPTQLANDLSGVNVTSAWDLNLQGSESNPPEMPDIEAVRAAFPQLEIIEAAGQGGMGAVFKARQPKLDRFVALKILPSTLESKPGFTERFHQEGKLLAKLNHPNIVAVHDVGESGGFYYLLMEYVDGVNLRQAIKNHSFTPEQAIAMVPKICDALQYAHDEGVLHRDIKPANILLDTKGRIKIADFGIAKLMRTEGAQQVGHRPPGGAVGDEQVGNRPPGDCVGDSRQMGERGASAEYRTLPPGGRQPTNNRAGCWGCSLLALGFVLFCVTTILWITPVSQTSVSVSGVDDNMVVRVNGEIVDMTPEEAILQHRVSPSPGAAFIALFLIGTILLCVCIGLWLVILQIYRWVSVGNRPPGDCVGDSRQMGERGASAEYRTLPPGGRQPTNGRRPTIAAILLASGCFITGMIIVAGILHNISLESPQEPPQAPVIEVTAPPLPVRTITFAEFDAIKAKYADLQLGTFDEYNIIELGSTEETDGNKYFDFTEQGLRAAITAAGNTPESDLIVIHTTAEQNTITLDGNELLLDIDAQQFGGITIVSFGEENLTIDGDSHSRIFHVPTKHTGAALGGLTLTNGKTPADHKGAAIGSIGTLTVTKCIIKKNSAGSNAGGVYNAGTMHLTKSEISDNDSLSWGGGIANAKGSTMTLTDCTIANNRTPSGSGGGIMSFDDSALTLTRCIIAGNSVGTRKFNGGGIFCQNTKVTITNCLIAGNKTSNGGGAMAFWGGDVTITNSTIVGNIGYQHVGGIALWDGATLTINNSIVAYNSDRNIGFELDRDVPKGDILGSNNLFAHGSGQTSLVDGVDGNMIGTEEKKIDPQFIYFDPGGAWRDWDLRLKEDSPAKEKGYENTVK